MVAKALMYKSRKTDGIPQASPLIQVAVGESWGKLGERQVYTGIGKKLRMESFQENSRSIS